MDTRTGTTAVDLAALERRLAQRACWHEDPSAYREGVRDALAALGETTGRDRPSVRATATG